MSEISEFTYSEARYADQVGISRDDCTFLRKQHLTQGVDWQKKNGSIALTRDALVKLCRALSSLPSELKLSECELLPAAKNGAAPEALAIEDRVSENNPRELTVAKIWVNPRMVLASDEKTGEEFHVIVEKNENFVVGMKLPAIPDERSAGCWRLVGPLPPRRGRWW